MAIVFIALGANLSDPKKQVENALQAITQLPATQIIQISPFYRSKPLGPQDQPDYLNAVIKITTLLPPLELLAKLQQIEKILGRVRKANRWGPRTVDLDILLYDDIQLNTDVLTLPHYDIKHREFVLYPLLDIAPLLIFPDGSPLADVIKNIPKNNMTLW